MSALIIGAIIISSIGVLVFAARVLLKYLQFMYQVSIDTAEEEPKELPEYVRRMYS